MRTHDAELNILKAVVERRAFDQAIFRGLRGEHFRDETYGHAWDFLRDHHQRYGVVPAQETFLVENSDLKDYLLHARAPEPAEFYADHILEAYARKGVAERLAQVIPSLEQDVTAGIDEITKAVAEYRLIRNNTTLMTLANTAAERLRLYQSEKVYGIPFGWDTLDTASHGAHPGDLIALVARAGTGKTFLTIKAAHTAWRDDARVLFIATEVPAMRIMSRFDAMHLGLEYDMYKKRMLTTKDTERFKAYLEAEDPAYERFVAVDGTGMHPSGVATLIEQTEPDIVFIDSFYKLEPDKRYDARAPWQKIQNLSNEIKDQLAMRYKLPVFVNTQFNRDVGTVYGNKRQLEGGLENIAGGDELGRTSDLVLAVSRTPEEIQNRVLGVRIIKGREVEEGQKFHIGFDFTTMSFDEVNFDAEDAEREEKDQEFSW